MSTTRSWFLHFCRWIWKKRSIIFGMILLSILLNILATSLFFRWPWATNPHLAEDGSFVRWMLQNPGVVLSCGIVLALCTAIANLASRLEEGVPNRQILRRYLKRMMRETEMLTLQGIPSGLLAESVPLDAIFIPVTLVLNRPRSDYPLTEAERRMFQEALRQGTLSNEIERILFTAESDWQRLLQKCDRVDVSGLWEQLDRSQPVAIIQGFPGMGKSTLLARLTLYMAHRGLGQSDHLLGKQLSHPLIPILVSLRDYAAELVKEPVLSLNDYIKQILGRFTIPGLIPFLLRQLEMGECLILLDGLDEVSELRIRQKVQQGINAFIRDLRDPGEETRLFNRFLITSRVAGYDWEAFPEYRHYTIAELNFEQIEDFLVRWCYIRIRMKLSGNNERSMEEDIGREARQMANRLLQTARENQGVYELAQNPLLLTLLAVMQQNSIELPRQRVELYSTVARTLLENRNIVKNLPPIPEAQAVQRLGPLAFQMQSKGNSFTRLNDVMYSLCETIRIEGGSKADIAQEAQRFLQRVRERGGLFVLRTGDYFGFFHRTFQEYFAARYLLVLLERDRSAGIANLIAKAQQMDDLWREPFLLAVAYKSGEDGSIASDIVRKLLEGSEHAKFEDRIHRLLLAAQCVTEAKPLTLDPILEKQIALQLILTYPETLQPKGESLQSQFEVILRRWLLSLPSEAYRPALLVILREALIGQELKGNRQAVLVLLARIASQLANCPYIVSEVLTLALLEVAGIESTSNTQYYDRFDLNDTMLAVLVLILMGKRGPAGTLLADLHQCILTRPDISHTVVQYGIAKRIALLPFVVLHHGEYGLYPPDYLQQDNKASSEGFQEGQIETSISMFRAHLAQAEEVAYPIIIPLVNMLLAEKAGINQSRKQNWQTYLLHQLSLGLPIFYQESALLWTILFEEIPDLQHLASTVESQVNSSNVYERRVALHFLATLSYLYKIALTPPSFEDIAQALLESKKCDDRFGTVSPATSGRVEVIGAGPQYEYVAQLLLEIKKFFDALSTKPVQLNTLSLLGLQVRASRQNLQGLVLQIDQHIAQIAPREMVFKVSVDQHRQAVPIWSDAIIFSAIRAIYTLQALKPTSSTDDLPMYWKNLAFVFLSSSLSETISQYLINDRSTFATETMDLLLILLSRTFLLQVSDKRNEAIQREIQQNISFACQGLARKQNTQEEISIRLEMVRSFLVSTKSDIEFIAQLAHTFPYQGVHAACAFALRHAKLKTCEDWDGITSLSRSPLEILSQAAQDLQRSRPSSIRD